MQAHSSNNGQASNLPQVNVIALVCQEFLKAYVADNKEKEELSADSLNKIKEIEDYILQIILAHSGRQEEGFRSKIIPVVKSVRKLLKEKASTWEE